MILGVLCEFGSKNGSFCGIVHVNFCCKQWFTKYFHTVIFCLIFCSKISDKYQISISDINQVIDITTTLTQTYPRGHCVVYVTS